MLKLDAAEATRQLFDSYADVVYRFSSFVLQSPTEAEDAVQEIFMKVFRTWDTFQGRSSTKTWLMSIARNHLYDRLRKQQREKRLLQEAVSEAKTIDQPTEHADSEMAELLQGLKLSHRQVIVLRYMQDMSTKEIAAVLGWSLPKVRTTLHRAIQTLRKLSYEQSSQFTTKGKAGDTCGI